MMNDADPILLLPSLAADIGLNEAIILQQIHEQLYFSWLADPEAISHKATGNHEFWINEMPWLSLSTFKRAIANLKALGLVVSDQKNKSEFDRTNSYSIDYEKLKARGFYAVDDLIRYQPKQETTV